MYTQTIKDDGTNVESVMYAERKHWDADHGTAMANMIIGLVLAVVALWIVFNHLKPGVPGQLSPAVAYAVAVVAETG